MEVSVFTSKVGHGPTYYFLASQRFEDFVGVLCHGVGAFCVVLAV